MDEAEKVVVGVGADLSEFDHAMNSAGEHLSAFEGKAKEAGEKGEGGFGKLLGGVSSLVNPIAGLTLGIQGVLEPIDAMVEATGAAAKTQGQLANVLASTHEKAGMTVDSANELADSLSGVTRFSKDAVVANENMLLTFTSIGKDVFPLATEATLNMSQALGEDGKSAAIQLGKALNDPIKGITALSRVGVSFTDQQKEQIKAMVKAGDVAGAQKLILGELNTEFGNSAKAAGTTFPGQLDILNHAFEEVQVKIGSAVLPILSSLMGFVTTTALPAVARLADVVGAGLATAFGWLQRAFGAVQPYLIGFFAFLNEQVNGEGVTTLSDWLHGLPGPIEAVGNLIGFIAGNFAAFFGELQAGHNVIQAVADLIGNNLMSVLSVLGAGDAVLDGVSQGFRLVGKALSDFWTALTSGGDIGAAFGKLASSLLPALGEIGTALLSWVTGMIPPLLQTLAGWAGAFVGWIAATVPRVLAQLATWGLALGAWLLNTGLPAVVNTLLSWGKALWNWITPVIGPMLAQLAQWGLALGNWILNTGLPTLVSTLLGWGKALWAWIAPMIGPALAQLAAWGQALGAWVLNTGLPALVTKLQAWTGAFVAWIGPILGQALGKLGELLAGIGNWITGTALPAIGTKLHEWAVAYYIWVDHAKAELPGKLGTFLGQLVGWIEHTALPAIEAQLAQWMRAFFLWVGQAGEKLPGELGKFLGHLTGWFIKDALPAMQKWAVDMQKQAWVWIQNAIPQAITWLGNFFTDLWNFITGKQGTGKTQDGMKQAGGNMIQGLIDGVKGMWDNGVKTIRDFFGGFLAGFQDSAGIHSPSTVFYALAGDIVQGLINGLGAGLQSVINAASTLANGAINTFKNVLGIHSPSTETKNIGDFLVKGLTGGITENKGQVTTALGGLSTLVGTWATGSLLPAWQNALTPLALATQQQTVIGDPTAIMHWWWSAEGLLPLMIAHINVGESSFKAGAAVAFTDAFTYINLEIQNQTTGMLQTWQGTLTAMVNAAQAAVAAIVTAFSHLPSAPSYSGGGGGGGTPAGGGGQGGYQGSGGGSTRDNGPGYGGGGGGSGSVHGLATGLLGGVAIIPPTSITLIVRQPNGRTEQWAVESAALSYRERARTLP